MNQSAPTSIEAAPTLKPCPFCGGVAQTEELVRGNFVVECHEDNDCDVYCTAGPCKTLAEAAEAWNRRAS